MSKYTTELRYICEYEAGLDESEGYNSIDTILTSAAPHIFSFDFPIFDENYRLTLEKAILRHFYTREICEETYGLWKLRLEDKLNLIMPYYNKLYESELLEFNPLYDVDLTTTHEGQMDETTNANNSNTRTLNTERATSGSEDTDRNITTQEAITDTNTRTLNTQKALSGREDNDLTLSKQSSGTSGNTRTLNTTDSESGSDVKKNLHWDLYSDTPQGGINGITADNDSVANNTYLTNARKITDDGTGSTTSRTTTNTGTVGDSGTTSGTESGSENRDIVRSETVNDTGTIGDSGNTNRSGSSAETIDFDKQEISRDTGTIGDSGTSRSVVNNLNEYTERVFGKRGSVSYAKMLMEFRDSFIRIEEKIMRELEPLFFGLW